MIFDEVTEDAVYFNALVPTHADPFSSPWTTSRAASIAIPAGCTILRGGGDTLRTYNYFANVTPLVRYSGLQDTGTGSDRSYNIGWVETDVALAGPQFAITPAVHTADGPWPITATAVPFLDRYTMYYWYLDRWQLVTSPGGAGVLGNHPVNIGNSAVIVRYKDPSVVNLGEGDGWLMIVARDLVREDVAVANHYPPAQTSRDTSDEAPCFPDSPGTSWPRSRSGSLELPLPEVTIPVEPGTFRTRSDATTEKCEYLADIVAFWSETEDFEEVIGPFWIRPSLVTEAAPDEPDWDAATTHASSQPRYWYGVPGAVVVDEGAGEEQSNDGRMLYVYFTKDQCYHNHYDRDGSVGEDPHNEDATLTRSERLYRIVAEAPQKLVLRKIAVSDITRLVGVIQAGTWELPHPSTWNELAYPLPALLPGEEFEVRVYDLRSGALSPFFAENEQVSLAGPMPALSMAGKLMLFVVIAKDTLNPLLNGIWRAMECTVEDRPIGTTFELGLAESYQAVKTTGDGTELTDWFYDPDPVFVADSDTSGTWYLFTGHGSELSSIWGLSASDAAVTAVVST